MFHLPIPVEGNSGEPVRILKRQSRGYSYNVVQYSLNLGEDKKEQYSVVMDDTQTKVFAYMPPRQTITDCDLETIDNHEGDVFEIKEAVEGTMVTFFWNEEIGEWDICTRNGIGGEYAFIRPTNENLVAKTFRRMVVDAFRTKLYVMSIRCEVDDLKDVQLLQELSKTHCYTCILQHPENHLVYSRAPFCSFLKLVAIYEMESMPPLVETESNIVYRNCIRELPTPYHLSDSCLRNEENEENETPSYKKHYLLDSVMDEDESVWQTGFNVFHHHGTSTQYMKNINEVLSFKQNMKDYYEKYGNIAVRSNDIGEFNGSLYYPPAWILTNSRTGHQTEVANPFYEKAKSLRDMQPNLRYLYLSLKHSKKVGDYLNAFPQYCRLFDEFEYERSQFIGEVHSAYVKYYIMKQREQSIEKKYFVHAARIHHNIYMESRRKITRQVVTEYFDEIVATKMYYFMYGKRSSEKEKMSLENPDEMEEETCHKPETEQEQELEA